jgi:hypothetical protein
MTQERLTALEDVAALATIGATYPELMLYLQAEMAKCEQALAAQPDYEFDYKLAFGEWLDKTEWVQEKINSGHLGVRYLGMHRADVLRDLAYPNTVTGKAPQQRPWQGLTESERNDLENYLKMTIGKTAFDAIEAKLKERNT